MRIVFRVDSSAQIGSGHLMRCLTLANEFRRCGSVVAFVSRMHKGHLVDRLEQEGHQVYKLPTVLHDTSSSAHYGAWLGVTPEQDAEDTLAVLKGQHYDVLIVDHYALDHVWEKMLRSSADKLMVIDDLANRKHDCDFLLDQNYFGVETSHRYDNKISPSAQALLGPQFSLLQPDYAQLRDMCMPKNGIVKRVLIFFGGVDSNNQTTQVLAALTAPELRHLSVDVVVGSNCENLSDLEEHVATRTNVILHQNLPTLAHLMMQSDLVIGAGGGTTWERMCLGCPALVVSLAENQALGAHALSVDGYQVLLALGRTLTSEDWEQALTKLIKAPDVLMALSRKAKFLVDGLGCRRVILKLLGNKNLEVKLRDATIKDEALLLRWGNDDSVREQSFCQDLIKPEEHRMWLQKKLLDPNGLIFIAEAENGVPLGQIRFDLSPEKKEALISISIDATMRGMGVAGKLLPHAMQRCSNKVSDITFIAEVRDTNLQSQRLFRTLNFTQGISSKPAALRFEYRTKSIIEERA